MKRSVFPYLVLMVLLFGEAGLFGDVQGKEGAGLRDVKRVKIVLSQSYGEAKSVSLPFQELASRLLSWVGVSVVREDSQNYDATLEIRVEGKPIKGYYDEKGRFLFTPFPLKEIEERRKAPSSCKEESEYEEEEFLWASLPLSFGYFIPSSFIHEEANVKYMLYTGAYLKGNIILKSRDGRILSEEFEGLYPPPEWLDGSLLYLGSFFPLEPDRAPFFEAFVDRGSFPDRCALLIGKAWGIDRLIPILGDKDRRLRNSVEEVLKGFGRSAVGYLASALDNPSEDIRLSAVCILGDIKDPSCFEPLNRALRDGSPSVREAAAEGLGKLGDRRAVESLLNALGDASKGVRKGAVRALAMLADPRALEKLIKIAEDEREEWETREQAIRGLGKIGGKQAVDVLIKLANKEVRKSQRWYTLPHAIIKALGDTRDPRAIDILVKAWREDICTQTAIVSLVKIGAPAVDALLSLFNDRSYPPRRREELARALGKIGDKRAVKSLSSALYEEDASLAEAVEWALYNIGEPSIPPLLSLLKSDKPFVREESAKILGYIKGVSAVEPLKNLLRDKDQPLRLRQTVARALGMIGSPEAVQALLSLAKDKKEPLELRIGSLYALNWEKLPIPQDILSLVKDKNEDSEFRESLIRFLAGAKYALPLDTLLSIINDPMEEDGIKALCVEVLGKMGGEKTADILFSLLQSHPSLTNPIALVLGNMGDARATPYLLSIIEKSPSAGDPSVDKAYKALRSLRDPQALPYFINLCRSDDPKLRQLGAELIGNIPAPESFEVLLSLLKDEYPAVRQESALSLGKLGGINALEPLLNALNDEYAIVRIASAKALGEIGDKRAVEKLLPLLKDPDKEVRKSTILALGKLGDARALSPLLEMLKSLLQEGYWESEETEEICREICKALIRIGSPAVEPLIAILKDKQTSPYVQGLSALILGEIGDARAVEPLISLLEEVVAIGGREREEEKLCLFLIPFALKRITQRDFGDNPALWREWWETNKSIFMKGG